MATSTVETSPPIPSNRRLPANSQGYQLVEPIGQGTCASVYRAWCPAINSEVAIKIVDLEWLQAPLDDIGREIQVMSLSSHPNVVPFSTAFVQGTDLWIVMPLLTGGSVLSMMHNSYRDGLPEEYSRYILWCVLSAIEYFHGNGQMHRDVKAANLMFDSVGNVMLTDYGMMGWMVEGGWDRKQRQTFVGTPCWMAPEVMEQAEGYDYKADIWSLGITAIELAQGHAPYVNYTPMKVLFLTLQNPPPTLEETVSPRFSAEYKDFIAVCLQKDPKLRPSAKQLKEHPLFAGGVAKPGTLEESVRKLPPIGSRGRADMKKVTRALRQELEKKERKERNDSEVLDLAAGGWDFGDESDSQKISERSTGQEADVGKTPSQSPPNSTSASISSDSAMMFVAESRSISEAQDLRNGAHLAFETGGALPASATQLASDLQPHNPSATNNGTDVRKETMVHSDSAHPQQQPNISEGNGEVTHNMRLMPTHTASLVGLPAKTVGGLLKRGRFTVSDIISPDRLEDKIDSFLDDEPSNEESSALPPTPAQVQAFPTGPATRQSSQATQARSASIERRASLSADTSPPLSTTQAPESRLLGRDEAPISSTSTMTAQNGEARSTVSSAQHQNLGSDVKPPMVRVVNVPPTSSGIQSSKGAGDPDRSFVSGINPVMINVDPLQTRPAPDPQPVQTTSAVPAPIPIHQVVTNSSMSNGKTRTPGRSGGRGGVSRPVMTSATQPPVNVTIPPTIHQIPSTANAQQGIHRSTHPSGSIAGDGPSLSSTQTASNSSATPKIHQVSGAKGISPTVHATRGRSGGRPPGVPNAVISAQQSSIPSKPQMASSQGHPVQMVTSRTTVLPAASTALQPRGRSGGRSPAMSNLPSLLHQNVPGMHASPAQGSMIAKSAAPPTQTRPTNNVPTTQGTSRTTTPAPTGPLNSGTGRKQDAARNPQPQSFTPMMQLPNNAAASTSTPLNIATLQTPQAANQNAMQPSTSNSGNAMATKPKRRFEVKDVPNPKSRFEVKDVHSSTSKTTGQGSLPMTSSTESINSTGNVSLPSGSGNMAPSFNPKPKSRFEVVEVEKPRNSTLSNGVHPSSSGPPSTSNSISGSRQGTPLMSPQPESVPLGLSDPAHAVTALLSELQTTVLSLVQENDVLKRELAMLRAKLRMDPQNGAMVGQRSISAIEVGTSTISGAGQPTLQHAQSANAILTHAGSSQPLHTTGATSTTSNHQSYTAMQPSLRSAQSQLAQGRPYAAAPSSTVQARLERTTQQGEVHSVHNGISQLPKKPGSHIPRAVQHATVPTHHREILNQSSRPATPQPSMPMTHSQELAGLQQMPQRPEVSSIQTQVTTSRLGGVPQTVAPIPSKNPALVNAVDVHANTGNVEHAARVMYSAVDQMQQSYPPQATGLNGNGHGRVSSKDPRLPGHGVTTHSNNALVFNGDGSSLPHGMVQGRIPTVPTGSHMGDGAQLLNTQTRVVDVQLPSMHPTGGLAATLAQAMSSSSGARLVGGRGVVMQGSMDDQQRQQTLAQDASFRNVQ